jgi:hypothetical protein
LHRSNIVEVFGRIDVDGSGGINLHELLAAAVRVGLGPDEADELRERFLAVHSGGQRASQSNGQRTPPGLGQRVTPGGVPVPSDATIDVEQFTELLVENELLIKLMEGMLVEGKAERERAERRQQGVVGGAGRAMRWHGAVETHRPCLADLRTDQQREELLEQQRKRGTLLLSP